MILYSRYSSYNNAAQKALMACLVCSIHQDYCRLCTLSVYDVGQSATYCNIQKVINYSKLLISIICVYGAHCAVISQHMQIQNLKP